MAILKGVQNEIQVKVTAEVDVDLGKIIKVPFVAMYKKPTYEEAKEIQRLLVPEHDEDGSLVRDATSDEDLLDEYLIGWSNVPTSTGEEYEFTPEHVAEMLEVREYRVALIQGFLTVLLGKPAMEKNLSRRGGRGR